MKFALIISSLLCLLLVYVGYSKGNIDDSPPNIVDYKVVYQGFNDNPVDSLFHQTVVLEEEVAEGDIHELLLYLFENAMKHESKYHIHPTQVFIYVYQSDKSYRQENLIAKLEKNGENKGARIILNDGF